MLPHMLQTGCHHVIQCIIRRLHDYMCFRVYKHWRPYMMYIVLVCRVISYLMLADMMLSIMSLLNTCICKETPWMSCKRRLIKAIFVSIVLCECNSLELGKDAELLEAHLTQCSLTFLGNWVPNNSKLNLADTWGGVS